MAFRSTVSQAELRETLTEEQRAQHETVYQPSRGGHFPAVDKPVAGTPEKDAPGRS